VTSKVTNRDLRRPLPVFLRFSNPLFGNNLGPNAALASGMRPSFYRATAHGRLAANRGKEKNHASVIPILR
jgi:hypothetical protein